jgi:tetratricopeptide (TPR) repeat protein
MALSGSFGKVIWAQGPGASTADDGFPAGDLTEIERPADTQAPAPPARAQRYAHAGQEIEVGYADAVLAFNNKNFRKALEHLDRLLAISPQHVPSLELQALTLRSQGDDPRSLTTYRRLIQLKPEAERGPYYFEAAMIFYKNKRYAEARPLFERAITTKFNVGASHFFLGNIAFQSDAWARAERHFAAVLRDAPEDLRLASHYYVGILQAKRGYGAWARPISC